MSDDDDVDSRRKRRPFSAAKVKVLPFREWMEHGACRKVPKHIFFPPDGPPTNYQAALSICRSCIHQTDCLEYALEYRILDGIWGATTRNERKRILKARGLRVYSRSRRLDLDPTPLPSSAHG